MWTESDDIITDDEMYTESDYVMSQDNGQNTENSDLLKVQEERHHLLEEACEKFDLSRDLPPVKEFKLHLVADKGMKFLYCNNYKV